MSQSAKLTATKRETIGKANRRLATAGLVPAIVYGESFESTPISLERHSMELELSHGAGHSAVYDLVIDGGKPVSVIIRALQREPAKGTLQHVDLLAVSADKVVSVSVAVHLTGDPEGVKAGGVLSHEMHEIQIEAKPGDLPEAIEADIAALEVGFSLHVRDLVAPSGVTILEDPDKIVCSVVAPQLQVEEVAATEVTEPELVGESEASEEE